MVVGSMTVETDVVIIGAGPGGYVAAIRAAQLGFDVILIDENKKLGGVCLNHGCIPTKALITASNYYNKLKELFEMGVVVKDYSFDVKKMYEWKDGIITKFTKGIADLCEKYGIEVIEGRAFFENANTVHIEGKSDVTAIKFKNAIIATGSSAIQIPNFAYDKKFILSSNEALSLADIPKKLVVIGGGYIGTEMGTVYGKLGCDVHILEASESLIPSLDAEIATVVAKTLGEFNVTVHYKTKALKSEIKDNQVHVTVSENGEEKTIIADKVLVVVGRKPNSANLGLEKAGVKLDDKGFIIADSQMKTSVPNIYAIGDVIGQPMLAHKASRQAKVAAEVIGGLPSAFDNKVIPFVVFNDPELMSVGLTEAEAKKRGYTVKTSRFPYGALAKAMMHSNTVGFIKVVADADTNILLGVHAAGPNVSELASEVALAIEMGATVDDLALTIHPHPTMSESLSEVADSLMGSCVHIFQPKNVKK